MIKKYIHKIENESGISHSMHSKDEVADLKFPQNDAFSLLIKMMKEAGISAIIIFQYELGRL